jgi:type II secretory pathway pseudopilin PulG
VAAFSLIELTFVLGLAATLTASAMPGMTAAVDDMRTASAARLVVSRLQHARVRAISRGSATAMRITLDARGYAMTTYEDGNRNGVLSRDIQSGDDVVVGPTERLADQFPGVDFGALTGIPGAEGSTAPGIDPIRLGSSDSVTFTPTGTATPGSLYLHGRATQYVVRIYGETGRVRLLKLSPGSRTWQPL